jgi:hypothetical protein
MFGGCVRSHSSRAGERARPQAKELADRYFFETVVRVHCAGEGASYTGLTPAGRDLGPAIPAADKALDQGSLGPVVTLLTKGMEDGLRRHFEEDQSDIGVFTTVGGYWRPVAT